MSKITALSVENFGQIKKAKVEFGDLTVLVGPQATGKSIFLGLLNCEVEKNFIHAEMKKYGLDWSKGIRKKLPDAHKFFDLFFGEGMNSLYSKDAFFQLNDKDENYTLSSLAANSGTEIQEKPDETFFLIPAQRVLTIRDGWPRPFSDYSPGDPFLVRRFSEQLRLLMEEEFSQWNADLFPKDKRLKKQFREKIVQSIFRGFNLQVDSSRMQKRLVIRENDDSPALPFMAWSAGQREFIPLLLGLYWLLPPSRTARKGKIEWVAIEELEMGLHPQAISATLVLVMDLLQRGYKVCLSTHSPHVLDVVWAIQRIQKYMLASDEPDEEECKFFLRIFDLELAPPWRNWARQVLTKEFKVHYFNPDGTVQDISNLDPSSEKENEAGWGGLTGFSGKVSKVVNEAVRRSIKNRKKSHGEENI